jgi:hypothetical protein
MNPEIKEQWVTALRSGEYRQGKGALKRKDDEGFQYCCLGVLCELAIENGVNVKQSVVDGEYFYDNGDMILPQKVRAWAAVEDTNPYIANIFANGGYHRFALAELNDGAPSYNMASWTFAQIADLIEEKF